MVSIYEARTSKKMGLSMKRLSWITVRMGQNLIRKVMLTNFIVCFLTADVCCCNYTQNPSTWVL